MKSMTIRRIFQAILLIFPAMLGAQYTDWAQYTNGRHITAIAEEGGFAWIGTTGGLVRVDTLTLTTQFFNTANSGLLSNAISAIAVDNQGNKWIGTKNKGLARYNGSSFSYYRQSVIGSDIVNAVAFEADTLWVGTNGGAARFDGTGWTIYNRLNSLPSDTVTSIIFGIELGWIGTANGIVRYENRQFYNENANLPERYITSISMVPDLRYPWIGMKNSGVAQFNITSWSIYNTSSGLPSNLIQSVAADVNGRVLAGTPNGLGFYDGNTWTIFNTGNSQIPENTVSTVLWKSLGNKAYIGTITGGLSALAFGDSSWSLIPTSNSGLRNDAVNGVAVASNGIIGAGSTDYLTYYQGGSWTTYSSAALGVSQSGFSAIAMDASGFPWIGTSGQGLLHFDGSTWTTYSYPTTLGFPTDNNVRAVAVAPNGDVWFATWGGVGRFNGTTWTTYNTTSTPALPGDNEIRAIAVGSDGTVWISDNTSAGPLKFTGTAWTVQSGAGIGLIPGLSWVCCVTSAGEPWIGTPYSGGALYNSSGQWRQVNTTTSNIPSNQVNTIALDKNGFIWFGTADGLGRFDLPNMIFTDIFKADQTAPSGLPQSFVNAIAVGPDNKIYAATDSGLAVYSGFPFQGIPTMQITPATLAFGSIMLGDADTLSVEVTNTGTADLIISLVQYPAGFSYVGNLTYPDTIAPGEFVQGSVRFAPTQVKAYSDTILTITNDPVSPHKYVVTGTGASSGINEPYMTIRNRMFGYDTLTLGRTRTISTIIKNTGFSPLRIDSLKFVVSVQGIYTLLAPSATLPLSIPEGDSTLVSISFQPQDVVFYGGAVKIVSNSPTSADSLYIGGSGVSKGLAFTGDEVHIHTGLYGLISIPYVLADKRIESVLSALGPYSSRTWRLFYWLNNRYYEYPEFTPADSLFFKPGISFWLIAKDTLQLNLQNVTATPAITGSGIYSSVSNYRITLRPGWNMIGNPFAYPVPWSQVLNTTNLQNPVVYNVRWKEYELEPYDYTPTVLEPWRGYFVYNRTASPIVIQVPPFNTIPKSSRPRTLASDEFILKAQARGIASKLRTGKMSVGMLHSSEDGIDDEDYFEAPPISDCLQMSIMDGRNRYAGNFKSISSEGAAWDISLSTTGEKEKVEINLDGASALPKGFKVFLLDRDRECMIPVQNGKAEADVEALGKVRRIRMIVGTEEFAEQKSENIPLVPHEFALKQNYPNPFNPETHIVYSLSQKSMVKLTVYNTLGQKVRTLFLGEQTTGLYPAIWDGKDDTGLAVNSGVYVCRLEAGQFAISKKMILIR